MSKPAVVEIRLNLLLRFLGLVFLVLGLVLAYLTSTSAIAPQSAPIFYAASASLCVAGLVSLVAKLE